MAEAQGLYEIRANGRDSLNFIDPYKAGEAFYAVKRDDLPKAIHHQPIAGSQGKDSIEVRVAMTVPAPGGAGHEHLMLDASAEFRAGYDAARQRQPDKAVPVQDMQAAQSTPSPKPSEKGQTVSDQQPTYELQAKGRDPVVFTDPHKAGEAFYSAPRENMARLVRFEPGEREPTIAAETTKPAARPGVYEHLFKDMEPAVRAGYEAAKLREPDKAVEVREPLARPPGYTVPGPDPKPVVAKENTVELVSARGQEKAPAVEQKAEASKGPTREQLQASLAERFEVASIGTLLKPADEYRLKGEGPLRIAFTDHGKQISTSLDTKEVIKGMADLAQAKGWREITAKGTPEFQRSMWMEGGLRGIHVAGYSPSKEDHERLKAARDELSQQRQPKQETAREQPKNTVEAGPTRQQEHKPLPAAATVKDAVAPGQSSSREQYVMAARSALTEQGLDKATIDRAVERIGIKLDAMLAAGQKLPAIHVFDNKAPSLAPTPSVTPQPMQQPTRGPEMAAPGR
jgi:hypothetical protein